jgi:hypothetical protein
MQTSVLHNFFRSTLEKECTVLYRTNNASILPIRVFLQPMDRELNEHHFAMIRADLLHSAPLLRAAITLLVFDSNHRCLNGPLLTGSDPVVSFRTLSIFFLCALLV